jgi:hypothetical protein
MTYSLILPFAFRALAQIDSSAASPRTPVELFGLALVALIVFVGLTGLLVRLARRALHESTPKHGRRRPLVVPSAWGLGRGVKHDAAPADSVPSPPAP